MSGEWNEQPKRYLETGVEDWMGASVWRVGRTTKEILGDGCGGLDGGKCLESGTNNQIDIGRRVWRTGWGQVSGEWDEQPNRYWETGVEDWVGASIWRVGRTTKEILGDGCEDWMGANVWRVERTTKELLEEGCGGLDGGECLESGTNNQRDLGRKMWRTGWGQVSGEWDEQPNRYWEKDVEDWMGASVWRVVVVVVVYFQQQHTKK